MPNSNTPANAAQQPNIEASSRHTAVIAGERSTFDNTLSPPAHDQPTGGWSGQHPHVFHLSAWAPDVFTGGTLQGATGENWKILSGQQGTRRERRGGLVIEVRAAGLTRRTWITARRPGVGARAGTPPRPGRQRPPPIRPCRR